MRLIAPLPALPAHGEEFTLTVHGDSADGTLPTFFGWTSTQTKQDLPVDNVWSSPGPVDGWT